MAHDFPTVCGSCLGDSPFIQMIKAQHHKECKICTRPFTVFRWKAGRNARYKMTEICETCCSLKNVCQVCLLDLQYGLPVQVRDTALSINTDDVVPRSDVNREYYVNECEQKGKAGAQYGPCYDRKQPNNTISKLQRHAPYYKRNRAHVCSFYARGKCTRGEECPYRHEMPVTGDLSKQNLKDRYYGVNDPVAMKLLSEARLANEVPTDPLQQDESINSLVSSRS